MQKLTEEQLIEVRQLEEEYYTLEKVLGRLSKCTAEILLVHATKGEDEAEDAVDLCPSGMMFLKISLKEVLNNFQNERRRENENREGNTIKTLETHIR